MNMYSIIYNDHVKDLVVAHSPEEAKQVMIEFNENNMLEIDPAYYDTLPIVEVDKELMYVSRTGPKKIADVCRTFSEPHYWLGIDDKQVQLLNRR